MRTLEAWLMGTLALVALYLVVTNPSSGRVFSDIAGGYSKIIGSLQGKG